MPRLENKPNEYKKVSTLAKDIKIEFSQLEAKIIRLDALINSKIELIKNNYSEGVNLIENKVNKELLEKQQDNLNTQRSILLNNNTIARDQELESVNLKISLPDFD